MLIGVKSVEIKLLWFNYDSFDFFNTHNKKNYYIYIFKGNGNHAVACYNFDFLFNFKLHSDFTLTLFIFHTCCLYFECRDLNHVRSHK